MQLLPERAHRAAQRGSCRDVTRDAHAVRRLSACCSPPEGSSGLWRICPFIPIRLRTSSQQPSRSPGGTALPKNSPPSSSPTRQRRDQVEILIDVADHPNAEQVPPRLVQVVQLGATPTTLPSLGARKVATVQYNYHINVDSKHYAVRLLQGNQAASGRSEAGIRRGGRTDCSVELDRFEDLWGKKYPNIGCPWRETGGAESLFQVPQRDPQDHLYDQHR